MFAVIESYKAGLFSSKNWLKDILAGCVVGVVALPLAMAFAIAIGAKPEQGIYTAIIAGVLVSLFGGTRLQISGPTGAFIVVLAGVVQSHGMSGLLLATVMAGVILLILGLTRLGSLIQYMPAPVVLGFTAGIAVLIFFSQWPAFLGLPPPEGEHFHQKLLHLVQQVTNIDGVTTLFGGTALAVLLISPRIAKLRAVPAPLIALIVMTLMQWLFQFETVKTIGSAYGGIPQGLPEFTWVEIDIAHMLQLIGPALTIAMLGAIESLLSALVADGMTGYRHRPNQELIGQGIANIVAPFFGGFASTGALARTATNIKMGAQSPLAGIVHACILLLVLLLLAPLATFIPLSVLAAVLFVVAWNMSEMHHVIRMIKTAPKSDVTTLIVTFVLTVFADLVVAVNIGILLAVLFFMKRMSESVAVVAHDSSVEQTKKLPAGVCVFSIEGPFFFAAISNVENALSSIHVDTRIMILRFDGVPFIDASGLESLRKSISTLNKQGVQVFISEANPRVLQKLRRSEIDVLARQFTTFSLAVDTAKDLLATLDTPVELQGFMHASKLYFDR